MQTGPAVKNVKQSLMFAHKGKPDKTLKQQTLWICVVANLCSFYSALKMPTNKNIAGHSI